MLCQPCIRPTSVLTDFSSSCGRCFIHFSNPLCLLDQAASFSVLLVYFSVCMSLHLSVSPSVCLSVCLSVYFINYLFDILSTDCHFYSTTSQPLATSWSQCAVNDDVICVVSRHCASRQEAFCRALLGRKKAADVASELTRATRRSSDKLDDILESWMDKDGTHKLVDIKKCCERRDVAVWGIVKTKLSELHKGT